jgi:hypothetical protein
MLAASFGLSSSGRMPPSGSVCVGLCVVSSMVSSPVKLLGFAAADNLTTALLPLCPRKYSGIKLISSGMSESKGPVSHHKQSNAHHRRFAPLRCGVRKLRFCIGERGASARFHRTGMGSLRLGDGNGVRSAALDQATNRLPHGGDSNPKAGGKPSRQLRWVLPHPDRKMASGGSVAAILIAKSRYAGLWAVTRPNRWKSCWIPQHRHKVP